MLYLYLMIIIIEDNLLYMNKLKKMKANFQNKILFIIIQDFYFAIVSINIVIKYFKIYQLLLEKYIILKRLRQKNYFKKYINLYINSRMYFTYLYFL